MDASRMLNFFRKRCQRDESDIEDEFYEPYRKEWLIDDEDEDLGEWLTSIAVSATQQTKRRKDRALKKVRKGEEW